MKILVETAEAADRLEELIGLALREDELVICRRGDPIAVILPIPNRGQGMMDGFMRLAEDGRPADSGQTSNHDEFYDENGLPE